MMKLYLTALRFSTFEAYFLGFLSNYIEDSSFQLQLEGQFSTLKIIIDLRSNVLSRIDQSAICHGKRNQDFRILYITEIAAHKLDSLRDTV